MDLWMPGAVKHDVGDHAPCDQNYPSKCIPHITWDKNATAKEPIDLVPFSNLVSYFTGTGRNVAPHLLWNPFDGSIAQFYPANSRSKSVVDLSGGTRTNRAGKVVIQIEALFFPFCRVNGKVYPRLIDTPCKNWDKIQNWVHSLGVPLVWPMGMPTGESQRNEKIWETKGGFYGHSQVPENTHTDPITWPKFVTVPTKPVPKPVTVPPFPGVQFFRLNAFNEHVTEVDHQLIRLGFTHHNDGNGYQAGPMYTTYTRDNVKDFQLSRGWRGSDADGYVGPQTWHDLHTL